MDKPSLSATWGGVRCLTDEVEALRMVIDWIWEAYQERHPAPTETKHLGSNKPVHVCFGFGLVHDVIQSMQLPYVSFIHLPSDRGPPSDRLPIWSMALGKRLD